jgi:hypothetical protein
MQPKQLIEKVAELRACATAQLGFLRSSRRALACPRFSFSSVMRETRELLRLPAAAFVSRDRQIVEIND